MRSMFMSVIALATATEALAQPFTYQGELQQAGTPANTPHDFQFRIFATEAGPEQMGVTTTLPAHPVTDGRFTATINPGPGVFTGLDAWVEIAVRSGGGGSYTTLSPRQKVTPAPYAARALTEWLQPAPLNVLTNDPARTRLFLNRTARLTNAEYFGFTAPVPDLSYGGMYINTPGVNSLPFYGYSTGDGSRVAWTAFQGSTSTWFVHNNGERLSVESNGNVGIGVGSGNAAAKLDVDGTVRAPAFNYPAPASRTISIPGAAFRAALSTNPQLTESPISGTYLDGSVVSGSLVAPLDLPHGSTLTGVTLYCFDNATGAFTLKLYRRPHGQFGSVNELISANSVNNGNIQTLAVAGSLVINHAVNSYYVQVDHSDWAGASSSVYSAVVTFTVASPD